MPISSTSRKAGPFAGNGATTVFPFSFKVFEAADLEVLRVIGTVEVPLTLTAEYTVALNADQNIAPGGTVTLLAPLATGTSLVVVSAVPDLQPLEFVNQGGFFPENLNDGLDRATIQTQQLREKVRRSIKLPASASDDLDLTLPTPSGLQLLAWNSAGDGLVNFDPAELVSVVAYGNTRADTFNGNGSTTNFTLSVSPGSVNNLAISIDGVVQVPGVDYTWGGGTSLLFVLAPPAGTKILVRYQTALSETTDVSGKANVALDNATIKPGSTDAVSRAVYIKQREHLSVDDFNGALVDDATALNKALTAAFESNRTLPVKFFDSLTIDAPIYMPSGSTITGPYQSADHQFDVVNGFNQNQGVLRVDPSVSIYGANASKLEDCRIIRLGLTEPTTTAQAITAVGAMAGTAIRTRGNIGFECENLQIIGFNRAMDFQNNGRGRVRNIRIDCVNGIRWQGSLDVSRLENVAAWPWLTVGFGSADARVLWRAGIGIEIGAPAYFTGSISGTTLTVTAVATGNAIFGGQVVFDQGVLLGTIVAFGTGTGGVGTYTLDTSLTLSSRALRARIQNDWTNVESCFTFGYQIGFQLDEAKHATIQNCAADNAAQLLFGTYNTEAQTKIGLNVQGESWNTRVDGFRAAAQGKGIVIQPTALGGVPWAPRVTMDGIRGWGNGTYHVHHAAGEMVLNDPSCESIYPVDAGHIIKVEDAVDRAVINLRTKKAPSISASTTAKNKITLNAGRPSVRDYGAVGDGIVDDTAAFVAALAANTNAVVSVPPGTYKVTSGLTVRTGLQGESQTRTTILAVGSGYDVITLADDSSSVMDLTISSPSARSSGAAVALAPVRYGQKVYRLNTVNQFRSVVVGDGCVVSEICTGYYVNHTPTTGVVIDILGGGDTYIRNIVADNPAGSGNEPAAGIRIQKSGGTWMTDNDFIHCGNGLLINPAGGNEVTWTFGVNNAFDSSSVGAGTYIRADTGGKVRSVQLFGHWSATNVNALVISTDADANSLIEGVQINGGRLINSEREGVIVAGSSKIKNIEFNDCSVISNGRTAANTYSGLQLLNGTQDVRIRGGKYGAGFGFAASQKYGIEIGTGCSLFGISGADVSGNLTGNVLNNSPTATGDRIHSCVGYNTPWTVTAFTPTSTTGSFTSVAGSLAYYRTMQGLVSFTATITVTTNGTAGGAILFDLPFSAAYLTTFAAAETGVTGASGRGTVGAGATQVAIARYDNAYLGGTGYTVVVSGSYRSTV